MALQGGNTESILVNMWQKQQGFIQNYEMYLTYSTTSMIQISRIYNSNYFNMKDKIETIILKLK